MFSINFANNLIEKYQTSAAVAIINAQIPFLDGEIICDHQGAGGVKNVATKDNISWGEHDEVRYFCNLLHSTLTLFPYMVDFTN